MAERKKPAKKKPAKKRRPRKATQRKPEDLQADGAAVAEDALRPDGVEPWGHLEDNPYVGLDGSETGRKPLTALQLNVRNSEIWRGKLRGLDYPTLAETYGLKPRQIEKICAEWRDSAGTISTMDPMQIIEEYLLQVDAAISELAAVAAKEKGSGRVGAIRARLEAMKQKVEFLARISVLPNDLGTIGVQIDLRVVGQLMVEALAKRELDSPELLEELANILDGKQDPNEVIDAEVVDEDDESRLLPEAA